MTDSSASLLQNKLTAAQSDKLMRQLFSPQSGIGLNYLRVPIGASDFTAGGFYTYDDNPPGGSDDLQAAFLHRPRRTVHHSTTSTGQATNPALKLMGSPWSAPAWMKSNNSLLGGSLLQQWSHPMPAT